MFLFCCFDWSVFVSHIGRSIFDWKSPACCSTFIGLFVLRKKKKTFWTATDLIARGQPVFSKWTAIFNLMIVQTSFPHGLSPRLHFYESKRFNILFYLPHRNIQYGAMNRLDIIQMISKLERQFRPKFIYLFEYDHL